MDSKNASIWQQAHHRVILDGELVILVGAVGLILSVIPLFEKKTRKLLLLELLSP
jgi:hypothetical protein